MINLPEINNLDVKGKRGLVRIDLDAVLEDNGKDPISPESNLRLNVVKPTVDLLFEKGASSLVLIAHRGRPSGVVDKNLSLAPLVSPLENVLKRKVLFIESLEFENIQKTINESSEDIFLLENIRFWKGEEEKDESFAENLSALGLFFVNEAFASSHRDHTSITLLPKKIPFAFGSWFLKEVQNLSYFFENPQKPSLLIISGTKKDKLDYLDNLSSVFDMVLIGGRFPDFLPDNSKYRFDSRFFVANLNPDKEDITIRSIEAFEREVKRAKSIALIGPIGKYEDEGHRLGTKRVFEAVANSSAFKMAGGGDTIKVIEMFGLNNKFDWVSVGGGATLEFLAKRTLAGLEV
jgi:3-phosphoglycerate kinase